MKKGWIKVHREIIDHWIFQDERHFRRWLIILLNVNHTEVKFPVGDEVFICRPGESFISIDHWATLFKCSKPSVGKFFKLLENEGMLQRKIIGKGNRRKHLITVMNWAKYQGDETGIYPERKPEYTLNGNPNIPPNKNDKELFKNDNNDKNDFFEWKKNFEPDWIEWIEYLKEQHNTTVKQTTELSQLKILHNLSNGDEETAVKIIGQAMAGTYKTFIALKKNNNDENRTGGIATSDQHATDTI